MYGLISKFRAEGIVAAAVLLLFCSVAMAQQVGLEEDDIVDDVKFTHQGVESSVTVLRDARQRLQFYYVPARPRIVEVKDGQSGNVIPEIALVKYQFPNPAERGSLIEGGVAQFSLLFSVPPEALAQIRAQLSGRVGVPAEQISVGPLQFSAGSIAIYGGADRTFIAGTPDGQGAAPTFATQSVSFQIPLTRAGVDIYEALLNGNTGFGVRAEYDYQGLSPPLGFVVEVDWDQAYSHFSRNEKLRAQVSSRALFGLFRANVSYNKENSEIRESLENSRSVKISVIEGTGFSMEQVDKYLQPLLARISQELLEASRPPPQISAATAESPATGNIGFSGGYSVSMKSVQSVKKGKETINFNVRSVVERKAVVQGFVGIAGFPEPVRKRIVRTIAPGQWQAAYFPLPDVGNAQALGVSSAGVEVSLMSNGEVVERQAATWNSLDRWKQVGKQDSLQYFTFPLAALVAKRSEAVLSDLKFSVRYTLNTNEGRVLEETEAMEAVNGSTLLPPSLKSFNQIQISPASLNWSEVDQKGDAKELTITVAIDGREFTSVISPRNNNGVWSPPPGVRFLMPVKAEDVKVSMSLITADGLLLRWRHDNINLQQLEKVGEPVRGVTRRLVAPRRDQFVE